MPRNHSTREKSLADRIVTISLVILPIANQYTIVNVTPLIAITVAFGIAYLVENHGHIVVDKKKTIYMAFILITTIIFSLTYGEMSYPTIGLKVLRLLFTLFGLYLFAHDHFDYDTGYKIYFLIVKILCCLIFFQYGLYIIAGRTTSLIIPNLKLNYTDGINSSDLLASIKSARFFRPSSVFVEPAYQAEYMIPCIPLTLLSKENNQNYKNIVISLIITAAICISASLIGIICCIFVWLIYLILSIKKVKKDPRFLAITISLITILIFGIQRITAVESVQNQIASKIYSFNHLENSSSLSHRVIRGFYCFSEMDFFHQCFGCGYNGFSYYYRSAGLKTIYDYALGDSISYMSGFFYAVCNLGVIGVLFYFYFACKPIFRKGNIIGKYVFVTLLIMMFGANLFESPLYFLALHLANTCCISPKDM